jgi:hypothetical protein
LTGFEFDRIKDQSTKTRPDYLTHRNYQEDMEIPAVIRFGYEAASPEKKAVGKETGYREF